MITSCDLKVWFMCELWRIGCLGCGGGGGMVCLLSFACSCVVSVRGGVPLPLGAWNGLRYFIVAIPAPSI